MMKLFQIALVYSRVSTDKREQDSSIEYQVEAGRAAAEELGCTEIIEITERETATAVSSRSEFQKVLKAVEEEAIDVVIVKKLNRLNRDEEDYHHFKKLCEAHQVAVYFYEDHQFLDETTELLYSFMAVSDAQYSRQLSRGINKAHRRRQLKGDKVTISNNTYGYRYNKETRKIEIDEAEAEVIRYIFDLALQNYGARAIGKKLYERGITRRDGKPFAHATILNIIRNPMRSGTMILNTHHKNFRSKKRERVPESEWIYRDDLIPAIISKETWEKANELLASRRQETTFGSSNRGKFIGRLPLSGKLHCAYCGAVFYRTFKKKKSGRAYYWLCKTLNDVGRKTSDADESLLIRGGDGCDNVRLYEDVIYDLLENFYENEFSMSIEVVVDDTLSVLREAFINISMNNNLTQEKQHLEKQIKEIENNEATLAENLIIYKSVPESAANRLFADYASKKEVLQNKLNQIVAQEKRSKDLSERMENIEKTLRETLISDVNLETMLEYTKDIKVYYDKLELEFDFSKLIGLDDDLLNQIYTINLNEHARFNPQAKVKENAELAYTIIKENPFISHKELAERCGISQTSLNYRIKLLKQAGRIARENGESAYRILK